MESSFSKTVRCWACRVEGSGFFAERRDVNVASSQRACGTPRIPRRCPLLVVGQRTEARLEAAGVALAAAERFTVLQVMKPPLLGPQVSLGPLEGH